jgi:Flp pilus assembly protein TadG
MRTLVRPSRSSIVGGPDQRGQALVEFSLAIIVFLMMLMGVVDLGRGIYQYNGVAEAAREIARVTSVHPGTTLGGSSQTADVVATQKGLVPYLGDPTFDCVDVTGAAVAGACLGGDMVRVTVHAPYTPVTPLLGLTGTWDLNATSTVAIQ